VLAKQVKKLRCRRSQSDYILTNLGALQAGAHAQNDACVLHIPQQNY
jgi:hypothetical protein